MITTDQNGVANLNDVLAASKKAAKDLSIPDPALGEYVTNNKGSDPPFFYYAKAKKPWGEQTLRLSPSRRYDLLLRNIRVLCKNHRNAKRRIFHIRRVLDALDLKSKVTPKEISQLVLEVLDDIKGNCYKLLNAAERSQLVIPEVSWIFNELLPENDGAIISGRPKVGKTILVYMAIASLLKREPFLGFGPAPARKVILISDDQADRNTRDLLRRFGIWDHPDLQWSSCFRMTQHQIDKLLEDVENTPGAVVVIDSLRSTSRSCGFTENDPELGALLYDLKEAVVQAGGSLWVIHHNNKSDDNAVGVEALSGGTWLAGAVNNVSTLHYLFDNGKPKKSQPERRLFSEGRGKGLDLLVRVGFDAGCVEVVSDWETHEENAEEQAKLCNADRDIAGAELYKRLAFCTLHERKAVDPDSGLGPLDLLKVLQLAPASVRVMADLNQEQKRAYKKLTRWLDGLYGYVEKGNPAGGKFKAYYLTEQAIEWAEQADWK